MAAFIAANGETVWPEFPRDVCGHLPSSVRRMLDALGFSEEREVRLRQVGTEAARVSGCDDQWKDMLALDEADGLQLGVRPADVRTPGITRVCIYEVDPADAMAATLVHGRTIGPAESNRLRGRFDALPAPRPCSTPHHRFAVVRTATRQTYLELDGCSRAMTDEVGWSQGTVALANDVAHVGEGYYSAGEDQCASHSPHPADLDADGRPDRVVHYSDQSGGGYYSMVTAVCLADGRVVRGHDLGFESFEVADLDGDGRAEILAGGTSVNQGGMRVYALARNAIELVTLSGHRPLSVEWGIDRVSASGDEVFSALDWGCADVTADPGRELVQVVVDFEARTYRQTAYRISDLTATVVDERTERLGAGVSFESGEWQKLVPDC